MSKAYMPMPKVKLEHRQFVRLIEKQKVDDITIEFFYKPHTLTLLSVITIGLIFLAFNRVNTTLQEDIWHGVAAVSVIFIIISILVMPNGPFVRPHPAVWRILFGISVIYFLTMVFVCFLSYEDARKAYHWFFPELANMTSNDILDKEYAVNCSQISFARFYSHLDVFAFAHFTGWAMKALLLRHYGLTWLLSVNWEITELAFGHILPNFRECWWDIIFLDIFLCNGLGIFVGMQLCKWLEMRSYHWESVQSISTTSGKLKRAFFQFTPGSWTVTRWLDPESSFMRVVAVSIFVVLWQMAELNCFFLKHIFIVKPSHITTMGRLWLISAISAPGIKQFYLYVTDPLVTRIGTQCWIFIGIVVTETIVCFKFGRHFFERAALTNIVLWLLYLILSSFFIVYFCAFIAKRRFLRGLAAGKTATEGNCSASGDGCSESGGDSPQHFSLLHSLHENSQNAVANGNSTHRSHQYCDNCKKIL